MASPELAIAKAALSASLFRADPTSLSRPAVDTFFKLVSSAVAQCSPPNVQRCKAWIVDNITPSGGRTAALGKFLVALLNSFGKDGQRPSAKRRRLHVLYVLNDVLYHVLVRQGDRKFGDASEAFLPRLFASTASFDKCPKHIKKLEDLVGLWEAKEYFSPSFVSQLREAITKGTSANPTINDQPASTSLKLAKDAPYVIPSSHGDPSTPWYDLPAANWLPHLVPNSTKPMLPDLIRPMQFAPGPADKDLVSAIQNLIADADRLFSKGKKTDDDVNVDRNILGERIVRDEVTREVVSGDTYYGWSREFCKKMQERKKMKKAGLGGQRGRSPSSSRSPSSRRSRSPSAPAFKRQRRSPDSRGRSHSPRRSRTRTRSPDHRYNHSSRRRSYSNSRSRSRSRSNSHRRPYHNSPPPPRRGFSQQQPPQFPPQISPPFPPVPPPGNYPVPPPPPPPGGYHGNWPPPPPPPPPHMGGPPAQNWPGAMPPQMMGGWPQVPLPPPPHQQGHQYMGGGNNGNYRGRGQGGYDRGRGGYDRGRGGYEHGRGRW